MINERIGCEEEGKEESYIVFLFFFILFLLSFFFLWFERDFMFAFLFCFLCFLGPGARSRDGNSGKGVFME